MAKIKKFILERLFQINDSPHKIALGLGVGVFLGVMPGLGIIAALVFAAVFGLNKLATLLGVLVTNTWLSIVTFLLSIRLGSAIMHLHWHDVYNSWIAILKNLKWSELFKASFLNVFIPVALGYLVISLVFGFIAYLITFCWLSHLRKKKGLQDV
ncbi:MAG: DUF2062 domain-containing protein [Candidatus Omnitrophica bacterium]|nr:DUF2062 domain-containing protein [Candidatus Omnitrophota bacterium]